MGTWPKKRLYFAAELVGVCVSELKSSNSGLQTIHLEVSRRRLDEQERSWSRTI